MKAVLFATIMEAGPFLNQMEQRYVKVSSPQDIFHFEGGSAGKTVLVAIVGMGKEAAREGTRRIVDRYAPASVLNIGIAGALRENRCIGDIFRVGLAVDWQESNQETFRLDSGEFAALPEATLISVDEPVFDEQRKRSLSRHGDIVDMEGAAIAAVCRNRDVPCVQIKGISDTAKTGDKTLLRKNLASVSTALADTVIPRLS